MMSNKGRGKEENWVELFTQTMSSWKMGEANDSKLSDINKPKVETETGWLSARQARVMAIIFL